MPPKSTAATSKKQSIPEAAIKPEPPNKPTTPTKKSADKPETPRNPEPAAPKKAEIPAIQTESEVSTNASSDITEAYEEEDDFIEEEPDWGFFDKYRGHGNFLYPNGDVYEGEYKRELKHGLGLYVFAEDGARYLGNWRCDLKHGMGKIFYADGEKYFGEWRKDQIHGYGVYHYANGDYYEGMWRRGKRHGLGKYVFLEAACSFYGVWLDDVRNGECEIEYSTHHFHGTYVIDHPEGYGVNAFDTKYMVRGYFEATDLACGKGIKWKWNGLEPEKYDATKLPKAPEPVAVSESEDECVSSVGSDLKIQEKYPTEEEEQQEEEQSIVNDYEKMFI